MSAFFSLIKGKLVLILAAVGAIGLAVIAFFREQAQRAKRQLAERNAAAATAQQQRIEAANNALHKSQVRSKARAKDNKFNLNSRD